MKLSISKKKQEKYQVSYLANDNKRNLSWGERMDICRGKALTENGLPCENKWVFGYFIKANNGDCFITKWEKADGIGYYSTTWQVDPNTVGRSFYIRENELAFEGDIVPYRNVISYVDDSKGEDLGMVASWYAQRDNYESWALIETGEDYYEILGNIYDNPEKL